MGDLHRAMTNPPSGSPNDFSVSIGVVRHLLGKAEVEEALVRFLEECQRAGRWVGLDVRVYLQSISSQVPRPAASVLNMGGYGVSLLLDGFRILASKGLLRGDGDVVWPTQELVDLPGLQEYRRG